MSAIGEMILTLVKTLIFAIKAAAAGIVTRVLAAFGLSLVTFNGVLPGLKSFLAEYLNRLPPKSMDFVAAVGLDVAMTMIVSALTVRMAWKVFIIPKAVADNLGASS